jgi:DNA repair metallo-beta-lactamase
MNIYIYIKNGSVGWGNNKKGVAIQNRNMESIIRRSCTEYKTSFNMYGVKYSEHSEYSSLMRVLLLGVLGLQEHVLRSPHRLPPPAVYAMLRHLVRVW